MSPIPKTIDRLPLIVIRTLLIFMALLFNEFNLTPTVLANFYCQGVFRLPKHHPLSLFALPANRVVNRRGQNNNIFMEIPVLAANENQWLRRRPRIVLRCIKIYSCPASKLDKTTLSSRPSSSSSPPQLAAHDITNRPTTVHHHHRLRGLAKPKQQTHPYANKQITHSATASVHFPTRPPSTDQRDSLYTQSYMSQASIRYSTIVSSSLRQL